MPESLDELRTIAVIPAFNEATRIKNVIRAAERAELVDGIIIVDDGSSDNTAEIAFHALQEHSQSNYIAKPANVFEHQSNRGKTEALSTGVEYAKRLGGEALSTLVFLDADSSPIWTRDTKGNMKLWQLAVNSLSGTLQEPLDLLVLEGRSEAFIALLARYIDEMIEPVLSGREHMRVGMYQRNVITDTLLTLLRWGAHAGNRAIDLEVWDGMMGLLNKSGLDLDRWEIEGALNSYVKHLVCMEADQKQGVFMMHGVVNVGSRVKAGSLRLGLERMVQIHTQAAKGFKKLTK